jgi:hypothetical protein
VTAARRQIGRGQCLDWVHFLSLATAASRHPRQPFGTSGDKDAATEGGHTKVGLFARGRCGAVPDLS